MEPGNAGGPAPGTAAEHGTAGPVGGARPAIAIRGLAKSYGPREVLRGVDLEVRRGELLALLGPNGAGKTTLVEIVEGYRRADAGWVRVLGEDPWRAGPEHRARLGLMLQEGGVDPRAAPLEALRLYAAFFRNPRDPLEILRLIGLEPVASTRYRRLSGGERQRLALGLALVGRPELLVLDEPTAGMDPAARGQARAIITELRRAGVTILLTTHDLGDVERLADRVAILDRGGIIALGAPAEVGGETVPALRLRLAAIPEPGQLAAMERRIAAQRPGARLGRGPADGPAEFRLSGPEPDPDVIAVVASACAAEGLRISELRTAGGSLEERYLELTGDAAVERLGMDRAVPGAGGAA